MKIKADTSGCDKFLSRCEDAYFDDLKEIGEEAVIVALEHGGASGVPKVYEHHTEDLVNANGACVVRDGKVVWMEVAADGSHGEAREKTESVLRGEATHDGLWLANGMEYASYVQSKGFDVIDSAILYFTNKSATKTYLFIIFNKNEKIIVTIALLSQMTLPKTSLTSFF